ncbi:MAG: hypothetical protein LBD01_05760, partial [Puniceicoccales bacterium]|nr:hypothetical protein [Puniceicoccales bacterium]
MIMKNGDVRFGNVLYNPTTGTLRHEGNGTGLYNFGDFTIQESNQFTLFVDNIASGVNSYGGAIHNRGVLSIGTTKIDFGQVIFAPDGNAFVVGNEASHGGAIYNGKNLTLGRADNTSIVNFVGNVGAESMGTGGAIRNSPYNVGDPAPILTIKGKVNFGLSFNDPQTGTRTAFGNGYHTTVNDERFAVTQRGGAIFNEGKGVINLGVASFLGNRAKGHGGAIYNASTSGNVSKITMDSVVFGDAQTEPEFAGNHAGAMDAGSNVSTGSGGAVYNSTYSEFEVTGHAGFFGNSASALGGGIYNNGTVTLGSATFASNGADDAGMVHVSRNFAAQGGAIYNDSNGSFTVTGAATFLRNEAYTATTGGITFDGNGGAIYNAGTLTIQGNATFGDYYRGGNASYAEKFGGAIYHDATGKTLTIVGTADFNDNSSGLSGGAIYVARGIVDLRLSATFLQNSSKDGGGAFVSQDGQLNFGANAYFRGNTANGSGGGLYAELQAGISMEISNASFIQNSAGGGGGGVFLGGSSADREFKLTDAIEIIGNTAGLKAATPQAAIRGAGIETTANLTIQTFFYPSKLGSGHTLFSGNVSGNATHGYHNISVLFAGASDITMGVSTSPGAVVDMRDPMRATTGNALTIAKTDGGTWKLGGTNDLSSAACDFTVQGGTLHLYRQGEAVNYIDGNLETVQQGIIDLGKLSGSRFALAPNSRLSIGGLSLGNGNKIVAHTFDFYSNADIRLAFDLSTTSPGNAKGLLQLDAVYVTSFQHMGDSGQHYRPLLELTSLPHQAGAYKLIEGINGTTLAPGSVSTLAPEIYLRGELLSNTRYSGVTSLDISPGAISLTMAGATNRVVKMTTPAANWNATTAAWVDQYGATTTTNQKFLHGDIAVFESPNAGTFDISIRPEGVLVAGLFFTGTANAEYKFSGGGITADPTGSSFALAAGTSNGRLNLGADVKNNAATGSSATGTVAAFNGTVDLTGTASNSFSAGIEIYSGRLKVASLAELGTGLANVYFKDNGGIGSANFRTDTRYQVEAYFNYGTGGPSLADVTNMLSTGYANLPTLHFADPGLGTTSFLIYGQNAKAHRMDFGDRALAHITSDLRVDFIGHRPGSGSPGGIFYLHGIDSTVVLTGNEFYFEDIKGAVDGGAINVQSQSRFVSHEHLSFYNVEASDRGGAIYNLGGMHLQSVLSEASKAGIDGGVIYNGANGVINIGALSANYSSVDALPMSKGGVLFNESGAVRIGSFYGQYNHAKGYGGTIYNVLNGMVIIESSFETLGGDARIGGVIYNEEYAHMSIGGDFKARGAYGSDSGGTIYNEWQFDIGGNFTVEYSTASRHGGGLWNATGATFTVTGDTVLIGNKLHGDDVFGGAISNDGTASFRGNSFVAKYNKAGFNSDYSGGGGAIRNAGTLFIGAGGPVGEILFEGNETTYRGGAILNEGMSQLTIDVTNSTPVTFMANIAAAGGAIYNGGTIAMGCNSSNAIFLFEANKADDGGAIYNDVGTILFDIEKGNQVVFKNNEALSDFGGAIRNQQGLIARGDNPAAPLGLLASFESNKASRGGGAIFNSGGQMHLLTTYENNKTTFFSNSATGADAMGGAIYNTGNASIIIEPSDPLVAKSSPIFHLNHALAGGAIANYLGAYIKVDASNFATNISAFHSNYATNSGGAILNVSTNASPGSTVDIKVKTVPFFSNSSLGDGGAIYNSGKQSTVNITSDAALAGTNFFSNNRAGYNNTGSNSGTGSGGFAYNTDATINISLKSLSGASIFYNNLATRHGGAIANVQSSATLQSAVNIIVENTAGFASWNIATKSAGNAGGFLYNEALPGSPDAKVIIKTANYPAGTPETWTTGFSQNAADLGGAIANLNGGVVEVRLPNIECVAYGNSARVSSAGKGGFIYNTGAGSTVTLEAWGATVSRAAFDTNHGGLSGGVIYNNTGTVTYSGTALHNHYVFYNNWADLASADGGGGAIYNTNNGTVTLDLKVANSYGLFSQNIVSGSSGHGGAIYNGLGGKININLRDGSGETVGLFVGNINAVAGHGGAIYNTGANSEITITNNSPDTTTLKISDNFIFSGHGGAIYNAGEGKLTINAGPAALEFKNNINSSLTGASTGDTAGHGGAIYNGYAGFMDNSIITLTSDTLISFSGNKSTSGGAIYTDYTARTYLTAPLLQFSNNGSRTSASGTETLGLGGTIYHRSYLFLIGTVEMINDPAITQAQDGGLIYNDIGGGVYFGVQNPAADS